MHTLVTSFLGRDCPGVVAAVAGLLEVSRCDIVAVSQTILAGEFAGIFTVEAPDDLDVLTLRDYLQQGLEEKKVDLSVIVRPAMKSAWGADKACSPFVVTANGPKGTGLVAAISNVFARHSVNIESLTAIQDKSVAAQVANEAGNTYDTHALLVFEVMVPEAVDMRTLRRELTKQGQKHNLHVSVQHKDIFEAMHRVLPI